MKLDRLNEYVLITVVMIVSVLLAIFSGRLAGTGDKSHLTIMAAGAIATIICMWMRTKIWLLIPMFWIASGQLNSTPGHLPFRDLIVILVMCFFCTLKAFKMIRNKPVYSWLDIILLINVLYVVSTYLRNPVGVQAFGSDMVGGRPYLEIIFALAGYWVLSQVIMTPGQAMRLPLLLSAVSLFLGALSAITYLFPALAPILGHLYGGVDAETYNAEQRGNNTGDEGADARAQFLSPIGSTIFNLLYSYTSPLTWINPMYLWRFLLAIIALFFCLKSGHRITVPGIAFTILLATYFRKGIGGVILMFLFIVPPFAILIAGQGTFYQLPETAQRTLSVFPGKWNPNVLMDAQGSTDWRVEMWGIVMHENKYIHNKTFGDGFGYTREVYENMSKEGGQEDFMLVGDVHSGPISAIRDVGYVGMGLFITLLVGVAIRAWGLIRATERTPFYPMALFIGVSCIWIPFAWIFVFGAYGVDFPNMVMLVAFLNLLSNGLAAYRKDLENRDVVGTRQSPPAIAIRRTAAGAGALTPPATSASKLLY